MKMVMLRKMRHIGLKRNGFNREVLSRFYGIVKYHVEGEIL